MAGPVVSCLIRAVPSMCFQSQQSLVLSRNDINKGDFRHLYLDNRLLISSNLNKRLQHAGMIKFSLTTETHCSNRKYNAKCQERLPQNRGCYSV